MAKTKAKKSVEAKSSGKETRQALMLRAKERGVKNFRVLNKEELMHVLAGGITQEKIDAIVAGVLLVGSQVGVPGGIKMRVKTEIDIYIEMGDFKIENTGCVGYLPEGTDYDDLLRVFGEPQKPESIDGKVKVQWIGKVNGLVFTIYDYKSKCDLEKNTDWHIGGKIKMVAKLVNLYFRAK